MPSDARQLIEEFGPDFADIIPNLGNNNDPYGFNDPELLAYEAKLEAELKQITAKLRAEGWPNNE